MSDKIKAYAKEILPMIRELNKQKDYLADFKTTDEEAVKLTEAVKEVQDALKEYLDVNDHAAELQERIKDISKDIKEAVAGAAKDEKYTTAELKAYFIARVKEEGVEKVVDKGVLFTELNEVIDGAS